jgi:hypothetical protein
VRTLAGGTLAVPSPVMAPDAPHDDERDPGRTRELDKGSNERQ